MLKPLAVLLSLFIMLFESSILKNLALDANNDESITIESVYIEDADKLYETYRQRINEGTADLSMYSAICINYYFNDDYENTIKIGLKGLEMLRWNHHYQYKNSLDDWYIGSLLFYTGMSYMLKENPDNPMAIEYLSECAECFAVVDDGQHATLSNRINVGCNLFNLYITVGDINKAEELRMEILNNDEYKQIYWNTMNDNYVNETDKRIADNYQMLLDYRNNQE